MEELVGGGGRGRRKEGGEGEGERREGRGREECLIAHIYISMWIF